MNLLQRTLLKHLLLSATKAHRKAGRPALAGYAFDHITAKIHIDGRFADSELDALETAVFAHLPRGGVCLDIGANIGNHAVAFADHFAHVHAFEPNAKALDLLHLNARLKDNITVHPIGLSTHAHVIEVIQPADNLGGTGAAAKGQSAQDKTVQLQLAALDDQVLDLHDRPITFAKIDVEGHEAEVIEGGARTLQRHAPVIGIEVDRRTVSDGTNSAVEAARALGYDRIFTLGRGKAARLEATDRLQARNYPLVILSTTDLPQG